MHACAFQAGGRDRTCLRLRLLYLCSHVSQAQAQDNENVFIFALAFGLRRFTRIRVCLCHCFMREPGFRWGPFGASLPVMIPVEILNGMHQKDLL